MLLFFLKYRLCEAKTETRGSKQKNHTGKAIGAYDGRNDFHSVSV